jgi:hypothetical protein
MKTKNNSLRIWTLLLGICLGMALNANAQLPNDGKFRYDPTPFIGKWMATSGDNSFEIIIQKGQLYIEPMKQYMDALFGGIIYKTNGTVTRQVNINGENSIFRGAPTSNSIVTFQFIDNDRKMAGTGVMTLDPNNPQKATWKLRGVEWPKLRGEDWNEVGFDIPTELEWTKIE